MTTMMTMMMMMIVRRLRLRPIHRREHLLSLEGVTIALVSHDYAFINEVCTDTVAPQQQQDHHGTRATTTPTAMATPQHHQVHYDNNGRAGKPCELVYYNMAFEEFQKLKPQVRSHPHLPNMAGGSSQPS